MSFGASMAWYSDRWLSSSRGGAGLRRALPGAGLPRCRTVATELQTTLKTLRPSLEGIRETAERTRAVEDELSKTLASARALLDPQAPLVVQLQSTLQEFAATSRSLRALADLVERDPSVLLRGKGAPSKP